ncbi:hypothetical protein AHF37_12668 [Paragonimus kellicotti]|nr:hypothetical protein AHF37_12668 [Paragonimus kellicotti]
MQELIGTYISLEGHYLREMIIMVSLLCVYFTHSFFGSGYSVAYNTEITFWS